MHAFFFPIVFVAVCLFVSLIRGDETGADGTGATTYRDADAAARYADRGPR